MISPLEHMNEVLVKRPCLVGVGNVLRGDDGVGLHILEGIEKSACRAGLPLVRAEDIVESYISDIVGCGSENAIFIDAVSADMETGSVVFDKFDDAVLPGRLESTHRLSMGITVNMLKQEGISSYILGVQAHNTDFGENLSGPVSRAADLLVGYINDTLEKIIQGDGHDS